MVNTKTVRVEWHTTGLSYIHILTTPTFHVKHQAKKKPVCKPANLNQYFGDEMKTHNDGARQEKSYNGKIYRASGNLFIIKDVSKTTAFTNSGSRDCINRFSASAGRRMRRYLRECVAEYKYMVTLTYPFTFPTNGPETKEHLRRFLQELKREHERRGTVSGYEAFSCFWFMEFQERGAPHYHLFTTWCPPRNWVSRRWYEICGTDDERHLLAGTRCEKLLRGRSGTISYASKYACKQEQKDVPEGFEDVGRFWGVVGMKVVVSAATVVRDCDNLDSNVIRAKNSLRSVIKTALDKGKATVIVKKDGAYVVSLHDKFTMLKVRMAVSELTAATMRYQDLFVDAELRELDDWPRNFIYN